MKTVTVKKFDFATGDWKLPEIKKTSNSKFYSTILPAIPMIVSTAVSGDDTFEKLFKSIMDLFDYGVTLVIVFAGAIWATGNRSKALEVLIGICVGTIIAHHAVDIRNFLRGI